jgi:DNA-binding beta-propeller fold protein YncE
MRSSLCLGNLRSAPRAFALLALFGALALPAGALGAPQPQVKAPQPQAKKLRAKFGTLTQLAGPRGCLVDPAGHAAGCGSARALAGPGPFMGSRAIAVSPDGKNVYVASSKSNAIAIFQRNARTGALTQSTGTAGCISVKGANGCAKAIGLDGPNSVAVSANGLNVYATSRDSNAIASFLRNPQTGALRQLPPAQAGCISALPIPGCAAGRALLGPDVVVISPDGKNVYTGSFFGNAVAVFARNTKSGALSQPGGSAGCIAETASSGCAVGIALGAVEGLAVSRDGADVYAASALSNALAVLTREPSTGALTQPTGGSGCIVDSPLTGCTTGFEISGANAVATSPGNEVVYVTSLLSNSVTTFAPSTASAGLRQKEGTAGCLVWLRAVGCSFGRAMSAPEGLAVSPDGANVYVAAFLTGAIDVLDRNRESGSVAQKPGNAGCLAAEKVPGCTRARALTGVSSIALSPDGRNLYSTSFGSNAVDIFRRNK